MDKVNAPGSNRFNSDQSTNLRVTNWRSILTLVVFFLTNIVVIFPFRIPLPIFTVSAVHNALVKCRFIHRTSEPPRRQYLYVNFLTAPMIAVLLLLATKAINGSVLRYGILALWLMMRLGTAGVSLHFIGCDWPTTLPRVLGCKERRRVWPEAALLPLSVLLDMCCSGWKRSSHIVWHGIPSLPH